MKKDCRQRIAFEQKKQGGSHQKANVAEHSKQKDSAFTPLWLRGPQIMPRLLPSTLTLVYHAISLTGVTGLLTSHFSVIPWYLAEVKNTLWLAEVQFRSSLVGAHSSS